MKSFLLTISIFLFFPFLLAAQTEYKSEKYVGPQDYTSNIRPNAKLVMKGPANDTLTGWQSIPFEFFFYGKKVDGYFISDDGYVTFIKDAKHVDYNNKSIPNPEFPNNAIYGYWEKLKLENVMTMWSNEIRSITLGEPPERFHVIMWITAIPETETFSTASLSFAVVLMEKNSEINIVYVAGRKNSRLNGIIGIENEDGSKGLMLENSPYYDFPSLSAASSDDITYTISENTLSKEYEYFVDNSIFVIPNPSQDYINIISNNENLIESVNIYCLDGKKISEINSESNTLRIEISDYPKGIYFVQITLNTGKVLFKAFIKK